MANITDPSAHWTPEYWSVDGVSLHQQGWSVTTVGGSRYDLPPKRGSNMTVAYRPGQVHRNKIPDARTITLIMFMIGTDPAMGIRPGVNPTLDDQRVQWNDNWDYLRRTVAKNYLSGGRVVLTRRWELTAPDFPTVRDTVNPTVIAGDTGTATPNVSRIVTASSYAEMTANMAPAMTGRTRADFTLDFLLADPYFYGPAVSTTRSRSSAGFYVWNDGHDVAAHAGLTIEFTGPLTNPILTNLSTKPDTWVQYTGTIPDGQKLVINPGTFAAIQYPTTGDTLTGVNKLARISSSSRGYWMSLLPGANQLVFAGTGSTQTGTCTLTFQPPYW